MTLKQVLKHFDECTDFICNIAFKDHADADKEHVRYFNTLRTLLQESIFVEVHDFTTTFIDTYINIFHKQATREGLFGETRLPFSSVVFHYSIDEKADEFGLPRDVVVLCITPEKMSEVFKHGAKEVNEFCEENDYTVQWFFVPILLLLPDKPKYEPFGHWGVGAAYIVSKKDKKHETTITYPICESETVFGVYNTPLMEELAPKLGAVQMGMCLVMSLLNCKNVVLREKTHERKGHIGKIPELDYREINIKLPGKKYIYLDGKETNEVRFDRLEKLGAIHQKRGHFKTFTPERPLFGRHAGRYWWNPIIASNRKSYNITIAE